MISNKQKHEHDKMHVDHVKWFDEHLQFRKDILALFELVKHSEKEIIEHEREINRHVESSAEADLAHLDFDHNHHQHADIHARMRRLMAFARDLELIE